MCETDSGTMLLAAEIGKQVANTRKITEKVLAECGKIEALSRDISSGALCGESAARQLDEHVFELRRLHYMAYKELIEPIICDSRRSYHQAIAENFSKYNSAGERIFVCVKDNVLFVRLPLLWARGRYKKWIKRNCVEFDYQHFFCQNLSAALDEIRSEIPPFPKKSINYLFVTDPKKQRADSDNYDTKAITDTITAHTIGGDAALNCTFSFMSITAAELE